MRYVWRLCLEGLHSERVIPHATESGPCQSPSARHTAYEPTHYAALNPTILRYQGTTAKGHPGTLLKALKAWKGPRLLKMMTPRGCPPPLAGGWGRHLYRIPHAELVEAKELVAQASAQATVAHHLERHSLEYIIRGNDAALSLSNWSLQRVSKAR